MGLRFRLGALSKYSFNRGKILRENWELLELDDNEWDTLTQEEYDGLNNTLDLLYYDPDIELANQYATQGIALGRWYANSTLRGNGDTRGVE